MLSSSLHVEPTVYQPCIQSLRCISQGHNSGLASLIMSYRWNDMSVCMVSLPITYTMDHVYLYIYMMYVHVYVYPLNVPQAIPSNPDPQPRHCLNWT